MSFFYDCMFRMTRYNCFSRYDGDDEKLDNKRSEENCLIQYLTRAVF